MERENHLKNPSPLFFVKEKTHKKDYFNLRFRYFLLSYIYWPLMSLCESHVRITLVLTIRPYSCLTHEAQLSIQTLYNNVHATLLLITFSHITIRIMKSVFSQNTCMKNVDLTVAIYHVSTMTKHVSSSYKT